MTFPERRDQDDNAAEGAVLQAWEKPTLELPDVGGSEKDVQLPNEGTTHNGNITYGPS